MGLFEEYVNSLNLSSWHHVRTPAEVESAASLSMTNVLSGSNWSKVLSIEKVAL